MKVLLIVYVFLMPFMSALALTEWLPLPLLFIALISPIIFARDIGPRLGALVKKDAGFIIAFFLGCAAIANAPIVAGEKNLNYISALLVTYVFFFCTVRALLESPGLEFRDIGRAARVSLIFLSIAIIVEFVSASFYDTFFSDIIPYAHKNLPVAQLITSNFKRPRAFAAEPGFTALAYECLWPLALISERKVSRRWWWNILCGCGFLLLGSAAAIVCISASAALTWVTFQRKAKSFFKVGAIVAVVAMVIASTETGRDVFWSVLGRKLDLTSAIAEEGTDSVTLIDRLNTYLTGLNLLRQFPLGIGWGGLAQTFATRQGLPEVGQLQGSGMLSLYLDIAVASGILGLLAFAAFVMRRILAVAKSADPVTQYVMMSLTAVVLHHSLVTELQYPFIWFSLAVTDKLCDANNSVRIV